MFGNLLKYKTPLEIIELNLLQDNNVIIDHDANKPIQTYF